MIAAKTEKRILAYFFILRLNVAAKLELREQKKPQRSNSPRSTFWAGSGLSKRNNPAKLGVDEGPYSRISYQTFAAYVGIFGGEHAGADPLFAG